MVETWDNKQLSTVNTYHHMNSLNERRMHDAVEIHPSGILFYWELKKLQ